MGRLRTRFGVGRAPPAGPASVGFRVPGDRTNPRLTWLGFSALGRNGRPSLTSRRTGANTQLSASIGPVMDQTQRGHPVAGLIVFAGGLLATVAALERLSSPAVRALG